MILGKKRFSRKGKNTTSVPAPRRGRKGTGRDRRVRFFSLEERLSDIAKSQSAAGEKMHAGRRLVVYFGRVGKKVPLD